MRGEAMHGVPSILPLRLEGVSYAARGKALLTQVSLAVPRGEKLLVLGPNGAGKSLTLRLAHGLIEPTDGRVVWAGAAGGEARAGRRHAMVFQRPVLLRRSARANLDHALSLQGLSRIERRERAEEALSRFGLGHLAERPARVLSGGEQQRLAMARAWALRPEVLFLDEPTAALDPSATRAIEEMIETFHAEGTTIVMTTHDLGQAKRLASAVAFLHHGRLVETAPAQAFFTDPATREARAFVAGDLLW